MDFSLGAYGQLLAGLLDKGYRPRSFFDDPPEEGGLLLRHDIDIDIFGCPQMAEIEESLGLSSTWFVQPNNDYYNPLSAKCLVILRSLAERHDVGLHIDPSMFGDAGQMAEGVGRMFEFYSRYIPLKKIFSFHRPAKYLSDMTLPVEGFVNAYDSRFTERMVYVSDSNRRPFANLDRFKDAARAGRSLLILTHPLWWHEISLEKDELLAHIAAQTEREICRRALAKNITLFADID